MIPLCARSWRCLRWQEIETTPVAAHKQPNDASHAASISKDGDGMIAVQSTSTVSTDKCYTPADTGFASTSSWEDTAQDLDDQWDVVTDLDASSAFGESEWSTSGASEWGQVDVSTTSSSPAKTVDVADDSALKEDGTAAPPLPAKNNGCASYSKATKPALNPTKSSSLDIEPSTRTAWCRWHWVERMSRVRIPYQ